MATLELVFAQSKFFADKVVCVICRSSDPTLPKPLNGEPGMSRVSPDGWKGRSVNEMIDKATAIGWSDIQVKNDPTQAAVYQELYLFSVFFNRFEPRPAA